MLFLCAACADGKNANAGRAAPLTWITEAEYQFGDAPERDVTFRRPSVRADPARNRVFVVDPNYSQVSAWTPEGLLLFARGRGEGPGEFISAADLFFEPDGTLAVVDQSGSRYTYLTAEGDLVETALGPGMRVSHQGFSVALAPPRDGVYVGAASIPIDLEVGAAAGVRPMHRQPLLRVSRSDAGQWHDPAPVLWLDFRNRTFAPRFPDGGRSYGAQPFGDGDQFRLWPGRAVVMRQKGVPGAVELTEVTGAGDTVWHRHLQFEPRRLTPRMVEDVVEEMVEVFAPFYSPDVSRQELRSMYNEAIYAPEYVPTAEGFVLTAAGEEVWLRTHEVSDTMRTHYAVRRDGLDEEPRRVLLPESMRIHDATATHVWGVWSDSLDVPHIVGRRLRPLDADSPIEQLRGPR